jgi:acetoacetyl-CoA synthetase
MDTPIWTPSPERIRAANLTRFIEWVRVEYAPEFRDWPSLYDWSIRRPDQFWPVVWRFCGVKSSRGWDTVLEDGHKMPGARWFRGARLNFAENLLRRSDDHPALVFRGETGKRSALSYREINDLVSRLAQALRTRGIRLGDRVAGYLPNLPETVAAMLAATSLGAVWSSCSPDFGVDGVVDRFGQIAPRLLFVADGYRYNGKPIDSLARLTQALPRLGSIETVVVIPFQSERSDLSGLPKAVLLEEFIGPFAPAPIEFEQLPFDHPVYILYSSGTTGPPKCIVHGAGGTLLQHLKELVLHTDLKPDDTLFFFTTCGWMMWNWLVSGLAAGATVLLYDGSPFHPRPGMLFDIAVEEGVSIFGAGAKYYAALEKAGVKPARTHHLDRLKALLSTGSPLAPESFDYIYRDVKDDVLLASISGGTDIISCFALGNPCLPVYRGELQCRGLGMRVEVFDDEGRPVRGEKGELVCAAPFPSMPVGFWNDPDGRKYRAAYFERFPGVWTHGDYAELTGHDGLIIHGRSDAVLNPGGVRIGTAEIYRPVETLPEVLECLAVGQEWQGDVRIILFVKLREGAPLDEELGQRIKTVIRMNASPRHVPAKVIQVPDIPRTLSGKIVELAVRNVIHGRPVKNLDALANPEALEHFKDLPALLEA